MGGAAAGGADEGAPPPTLKSINSMSIDNETNLLDGRHVVDPIGFRRDLAHDHGHGRGRGRGHDHHNDRGIYPFLYRDLCRGPRVYLYRDLVLVLFLCLGRIDSFLLLSAQRTQEARLC